MSVSPAAPPSAPPPSSADLPFAGRIAAEDGVTDVGPGLRLSEMRPRGVWDIVDDAFDFYRARFAALAAIAALAYAPAYATYSLVLLNHLNDIRRAARESDVLDNLLGATWESALVGFPLMAAGYTFQAAATAAVVAAEAKDGTRLSAFGAYREAFRRFFPLLFSAVFSLLATALGSLVFTIGAIYVMVVLAFLPQAVVIERRGARSAWKRSQDMARAEGVRVFGMGWLMTVIALLLFLALLTAGYVLQSLVPLGGDAVAKETRQALLAHGMYGLVSLLLSPLYGIALTLLYFDIRVRREGLDVVARAEAVGVALAPDPFGDMTSEAARHRYFRKKGRG